LLRTQCQACGTDAGFVINAENTGEVFTTILINRVARVAIITPIIGGKNTLDTPLINFDRGRPRIRDDRAKGTALCQICCGPEVVAGGDGGIVGSVLLQPLIVATGHNRVQIAGVAGIQHRVLFINRQVECKLILIIQTRRSITCGGTSRILQGHPRLKNASKFDDSEQQNQQYREREGKLSKRLPFPPTRYLPLLLLHTFLRHDLAYAVVLDKTLLRQARKHTRRDLVKHNFKFGTAGRGIIIAAVNGRVKR